MNKVMNAVSEYIREDLPNFRSGDTINVGVKVIEGTKSRVQNFEGVVIAKSSGGGRVLPSIMSADFSAIIITGAYIFPFVI